MTPEGRVKKEIKAYLNSIGAYYFMPVQTGYGAKTLDILACIPTIVTPVMLGRKLGLFAAVEAKRPGAHASTFQQITINRIKDVGGLVTLAYSDQAVRDMVDSAST